MSDFLPPRSGRPLGPSARFRRLAVPVAVAIGTLLSLVAPAAGPGTNPPPGGTDADALTASALRLIHNHCASCHNDEKRRGGLSLATRERLLEGGDVGKVIEPGDADASRLLAVLAPESDPHMPPKRQLTPAQIGVVGAWIDAGAPWDAAVLTRLAAPRDVTFEPIPPGPQPVLALALAPDGKRLAVGRGAELVIHDVVATNAPVLHAITPHRDLVRAIAWSPDGRRLATGGFRELTVRDAETLAPVWSVSSNLVGRLTALRFTPHGGALIAADSAPAEAGWVRIFAADTGVPLAAWRAHDDTLYDLAIGPDGGVLATAGGDRLVRTWELVSQREIARFEAHAGAVLGIAFNPSASELVSVGADRALKLWDVKTREAVVTIGGRPHNLNAIAWSADGSRVVAADEQGGLTAFTDFKRHSGEQSSATASERELGDWSEALHAVAVSADGRIAFAGGDDGVVHGVDRDGKRVAQLTPPASPASDAAVPTPAVEAAPSFVHDVLPVLAKAGCSAGACHAKAEGQNGFKLSVFSYDPASDHAEIVKEGRGRRVSPAAPRESLLLLKPTATIDHGGGQRLDPASEDYALVLRWIRGGMIYQNPNEPALVGVSAGPHEGTYRRGAVQPLRVDARYSDGSTRDVTRLADYTANAREIVQVDDQGVMRVGSLAGEGVVVVRFMGMVDAARVTVPAEHVLPAERYAALPAYNFIDELAHARFRQLGLFPSDLCTDAEFLRRAHLDTLGVLPTPAEAREFLANPPDPGSPASRARRAALVDRLLARPEFADHWANKWADLLRPNPDRVGVKSVFTLDQWLRQAFRDNQPYDQFAREILLAEGNNHRDGPIVIYRDRREPPELTTLFSQVFLGVRLECAKCHHHPNEKWSQDDFYQFAAVFGSLKQKGAGLSPPISAGTETFYHAPGGSVKHPVTGASMKPRAPDGPELDTTHSADPRRALADWLTAPGNPFFARAVVNRVWAAFFGLGFVEPVDDFRVSNPPSNEPLLDALAADFAAHGHDLKHLMRTVLSSRTYQLGSTPNDSNLADTRHFSRSYRRRLPAEVLADAISDITGVGDDFNGCPPGTRALQTWSYKVRSQLLDAFGRPNPSSDCPCERDLKTSVVQALHLMNSRRLQEKLASPDGRVKRLADGTLAPADIVTELFLATLARFPNADEVQTATAAYAAPPPATRQTATEDVLWALLNSAEFLFNH